MTHIISCEDIIIDDLNNAEAIRRTVESAEKFPADFKDDVIQEIIIFAGEQLIARHSYEPKRTCDDWHCGSDVMPGKPYCKACQGKAWAKRRDGAS